MRESVLRPPCVNACGGSFGSFGGTKVTAASTWRPTSIVGYRVRRPGAGLPVREVSGFTVGPRGSPTPRLF